MAEKCADKRCDWFGEEHSDEFRCAEIVDSWGSVRFIQEIAARD